MNSRTHSSDDQVKAGGTRGQRVMVAGALLLLLAAAAGMVFLRQGEQLAGAVEVVDASNKAGAHDGAAGVQGTEQGSSSSPDGRRAEGSASANSRALSSLPTTARSASRGEASSAEGDFSEGPVAGTTKVRDRSADVATRSGGQMRGHDHQTGAGGGAVQAGLPSVSSSTTTTIVAGTGSTGATAAVTGSGKATDAVAAVGADPKGGDASAAPVKPAELPVVYQLSDEELLAHSPGVPAEVLEPIREQFEQDAGVGVLDTADPEYARRWNRASPSADERYRTLFGWAAYNEMTRRVAQEKAAQAQGE